MDRPSFPRVSTGTKLGERLKYEKHDSLYADLCSGEIKNEESTEPTSLGIHQKQRSKRKAMKNEELIKHMSNLPIYLERGENHQEKVLNFGVLDWCRLEKWQSNHKHVSLGSDKQSTSTSNTSSFLSTDESSTHSSHGRSCSPACQKTNRPRSPSNVRASCTGGYTQDVKSFPENIRKLKDLKSSPSNPLEEQQSTVRSYQSLCNNALRNKLKEYKEEYSIPQQIPTTKNLNNFSCSKGKMKIQDGASANGLEMNSDPDCFERDKTIVHGLQGCRPKDGKPFTSLSTDSTNIRNRRSLDASWRDFSETSNPKEVYRAEPISDISRICSLPSKLKGMENLQTKQIRSKETHSAKISSVPYRPSPFSVNSSRPTRGQNMAEKKSTTMPLNSSPITASEGSDLKMGSHNATKARNPSPTNKFSVGIARIRTSSSKESSCVPKPSLKPTEALTCSVDSNRDKSNGRGHSSPLKRLLDPLLKTKQTSSHHVAETSRKDSISTEKAFESSAGREHSSTLHTVKLKLDLKNCKTIDIDDPHHCEKRRSSIVQALIQVAIKNGLPLFTLAVDNISDILAATMKKLTSSKKEENSWIYTFVAVREVKRKNGNWLNQGGKSKDHGYIPNVVAQLKVSDPLFSHFSKQNNMSQFRAREFVLYAVDQRKEEQAEFQAKDELAAIIVKFPNLEKTSGSLNRCGQQGTNLTNIPVTGQGESLAGDRGCYSNYTNVEENMSCFRSQDLFSTTIVLPGGHHGHPSKGEPSPLIERWKSGGLCDCGGWDLGCGFSVLTNKAQHNTKYVSTKSHLTTGLLELFPQGVMDDRPLFRLAPFKDGIFSVEFDSSISHQQALAICIAILSSGKKLSVFSDLSNMPRKKSSEENKLLPGTDGIKSSNKD